MTAITSMETDVARPAKLKRAGFAMESLQNAQNVGMGSLLSPSNVMKILKDALIAL